MGSQREKGPALWLLAVAWWPLASLTLTFLISLFIYDPGVFVGDFPASSNSGANVCRGRADVFLTQTFPTEITQVQTNSSQEERDANKMVFIVAVAVCQEDEMALAWLEGLCSRTSATYHVSVYHKVHSLA